MCGRLRSRRCLLRGYYGHCVFALFHGVVLPLFASRPSLLTAVLGYSLDDIAVAVEMLLRFDVHVLHLAECHLYLLSSLPALE